MPSSPSRPAAEEIPDMGMADGEVPLSHAAEAVAGGAVNHAAPGSDAEEDEEVYDDESSVDSSYYIDSDERDDRTYYIDSDESDDSSDYIDSDESDWDEDEVEEEGAGGGRASGSEEEEEAASADVSGGAEAEESPRAVATCCICMDPLASYGAHRICCIPCGHVYGRSCLKRWLLFRLRCGNTRAKCPQCGQRFKHKHIINLYIPVHLWNDCCHKEIRAQSTSSSASIRNHPKPDASRIADFEAKLAEERNAWAAQRRLWEEAERRLAEVNQNLQEQINMLFDRVSALSPTPPPPLPPHP